MALVTVVGAGLGGLSTALRLSSKGYQVRILEKGDKPGGRLNIIRQDGFNFDMGPSFFSMSYEFEELFKSCGVDNPLHLEKLDPVYQIFFRNKSEPVKLFHDIALLEKEFSFEPNFRQKYEQYIRKAAEFFHDTEGPIIQQNFDSLLDYFANFFQVPLKHTPYLFRTMWEHLDNTFEHERTKVIFSLVAFFLGSTPYKTPAIYSLLNYTEMEHDGYWAVKGGMYSIVSEIVKLLESRGVEFHYNTEICSVNSLGDKVFSMEDQTGKQWKSDIFVVNSDAAAFRGLVMGREKYKEAKLDRMDWTLAPFTIYLGLQHKVPNLLHHNYFLGDNFKEYAGKIFTTSETPENPYYYVNVPSKTDPSCAPEGMENIFILCPVPDLRFKKDWSDKNQFAKAIIKDLEDRIGFEILGNIKTKMVMSPEDWAEKFNLYKGSGLGLAHGMTQVGGFRPKNFDEKFDNLFYVGASTTPGTGLPMVVISSRLVTERIEEAYAKVQVR
jgi:phytoene desaturase